MNETIPHDKASDMSASTDVNRIWTPETAKSPDSEKVVPAAADLMKQAVQGAHETIDRIAGGAAPAVQQLGEKRDEWVDGARTTVRNNPLVSVAAAFALGALIARITG